MISNKKLFCMVLFITFILCTSSVGAENINNVINNSSNTYNTLKVNESSSDEYVYNDHNDDLTDPKYVNPNDYYFDDEGNRINYTSDTASFNNVTMSNGYNAYAVHHSGYIESNDSKKYPIFWNDTFEKVSPDDTLVVVGHWHLTNKTPMGEFLKILIYRYLDSFNRINNPNVPNSIYLQSYIWDFYDNVNNYDNLSDANKAVVDLYNSGFRVNNTGAIKWTNSTHYKVYDFMGFKNLNRSHKDLWGFKVTEFDVVPPSPSNNSTNTTTNTTNTNNITNNTTTPINPGNNTNYTPDKNINQSHDKFLSDNDDSLINSSNNNTIPLLNTGNPLYLIFSILIILGLIPFNKRFRK